MRAPVPFSPPPLPVRRFAGDPRRRRARRDIAPADWNATRRPGSRFCRTPSSPRCTTPAARRARTGWQPRFLTAWSDGALVGAMPLYAKAHSYGEYVFDWGWADALSPARPALLSEARRRDSVHAGARTATARRRCANATRAARRRAGASASGRLFVAASCCSRRRARQPRARPLA